MMDVAAWLRTTPLHTVDLDGVTAPELDLTPNIPRGGAKASLEKLPLG